MEGENSKIDDNNITDDPKMCSTEENTEKEEERQNKERSSLSLEGGKKPLSLYTRRVINIAKIREYLKENSTHGLCGGHNLGNTCFMNSSIACLSNCTELTCYFLSGDYIKDINKNNKYGMEGKLAEAWGDLLHEYWVEHTNVGDPTDLKRIFGRKVKRFGGTSQQDSNEFIDLFLDYLNEDLKAQTNNKYLELKEKGENETDIECSKRYWEYYLNRNDSIITDLFCGQLKCTITCPKCNLVNITFDPFNTLNLNVPEMRKKKYFRSDFIDDFSIFYVPKYCIRTPVKVVFDEILKKATLKDCFRCLKIQEQFKYHKVIDKLVITEVSEKKLIQFINQEEDNASLKEYSKNFIFCFDIMNEKENINIPIYFKDNKGFSEFPRIIMLSEENSNLDDFRKKIYFNIRKLILSPLKKNNEEIDSLSDEIKKYTTNIEIKDEYIFDLINKEYQEVFNSTSKSGEDNENFEYINNFIEDIPFKLYLTKDIKDNNEEKIYIINEKNFLNISSEFTELTKIKDYKDSIKNLLNILKNDNYYIVLELKRHSKYINEKLYKINTCVRCNCEYSEEKEEEKNDVITLKKCFELFTKEEDLSEGDEWYCPKCKKHVLAKKKMELFYLPKILIICFKRFTKYSYYWERNNEIIYFPIENLNMEEFVVGPDKGHSIYDLFGVSQHYGGTGFGHYTAICKNLNNWYSYNDSSVHSTKPENILSEAAYVLFYRRKTD